MLGESPLFLALFSEMTYVKVTTCFFIMVTLAFGVSSIFAQDPSSGEVFSTSSSYSTTDVSVLEYRLSKMEDELKKKQDKTDTKKRFRVNIVRHRKNQSETAVLRFLSFGRES